MRDSEHPGRPEITFDIGYLLAEIEEMKLIAERGGYGTLVYMLEVAAIEARHQAVLQREEWELAAQKPAQ